MTMRNMQFSVGYERFYTGVADSILRPRILVPGKAPVLYCHGTGTSIATGTCQPNASDTTLGVTAIAQALVAAGHVVVCPMVPNLWGNTTAQAVALAAVQYAQANLGAGNIVAGLGMSQGGAAMLRYMMTLSSLTWGCGVGLIGAVDMEQIRTDNPASQRAAIDSAYSVTYPASLPAGVNPSQNTSAFTNIHLQWWGASNDGTVSSVAAQTMMGAVTHGSYTDVGALGHSDAAVLAVDPSAVVEFIRTHT